MNISKRNILLTLVIVAAVVGAHLATVAVGKPSAMRPPQGPDNMLVRWLGLSGDEATTVTAAHKSFRRDMRRLQRRVEIESLELASLIEADETTDQQLLAQFDKVSNAHVAVHKRVAELVLAVRPHLDSDQRARFNDMISRHLRGKSGRGGRGEGGRGGHRGRGGRGQGGREGMRRGPEGGREFRRRPGDRQPPRDQMRRRPMPGRDGQPSQPGQQQPPSPDDQSDGAR